MAVIVSLATVLAPAVWEPAALHAASSAGGAPTITTPPTSMLVLGSRYTVAGTASPGSAVILHFHKAGTSATDYSIVRTVTADASGRWSRAGSPLDTDYRVYATAAAGGAASTPILIQASPVLSTPGTTRVALGASSRSRAEARPTRRCSCATTEVARRTATTASSAR